MLHIKTRTLIPLQWLTYIYLCVWWGDAEKCFTSLTASSCPLRGSAPQISSVLAYTRLSYSFLQSMADRSEVCPYLGRIHLHSERGTDIQLTMEFRNITDNEQHKQINGIPGTHSVVPFRAAVYRAGASTLRWWKEKWAVKWKRHCKEKSVRVREKLYLGKRLPVRPYPMLHRHFPMGTSHSPSVLQYIFGGSSSLELLTHEPLTSTSDWESVGTVSGNIARFLTVKGHF